MSDVFSAWSSTRKLVLIPMVAAIYAVAQIVLAPLSPVLIPGVLEFKLSNVLTMAFGVLFGPAGAWGVAFGNVVGDLFTGNFALGSVFGFLSTFVVAYVGYRAWALLRPVPTVRRPPLNTVGAVVSYALAAVVAAAAAAVTLAWGLELLGIAPYHVIANVLLANFVIGSWIGAAVYALLRTQVDGFVHDDVIEPGHERVRLGRIGVALVSVGGVGGWLIGAFVLTGTAVTLITGVFFLALIAGVVLMSWSAT
jgi:energy-coupling factor transport system substrate-specific component